MRSGALDEVTRVYSKDNALLQCRNWLRANVPRAEQIETSSTAEAARRAAEEPYAAAIASELAAETYRLDILAERIEDTPQNFTRFFVIGRQRVKPTGDDKTSVVIGGEGSAGGALRIAAAFRGARDQPDAH